MRSIIYTLLGANISFKLHQEAPPEPLAGLAVSARGLGGGLVGYAGLRVAPAQHDELGVALETQPNVVLGGRVLVGPQPLAQQFPACATG